MGNLSIFLNHHHFKANQLLVSEGQIIGRAATERRNSLKPSWRSPPSNSTGARGRCFTRGSGDREGQTWIAEPVATTGFWRSVRDEAQVSEPGV